MTNKNTSFSIIIPVYNTNEQYLRECLDSIINIKYDNFEVIIIDDGSNKKTKDILENYNKYSYINIHHQENKGISASRFKGINIAKNEYIFFEDSDDIININALSILNEIVLKHHPDFISKYAPRFSKSIDKLTEEPFLFEEGPVSKDDLYNQLLSLHMNGISDVVAKKELYKDIDKNIDFSIINGEDLQQTTYLALKSNSFYYTRNALDYYRFNEDKRDYYDVTKIHESNFLVPTYKMFFIDTDKYSNLRPIYLKSATNAILYIAFQICWVSKNHKDLVKYLNELNDQEITKILKKDNAHTFNPSSIIFGILNLKLYTLFDLIAYLYKLLSN